jgi:alpha-ketoglutarate-dependent taurine dioxygenase
MRHEPLDPVGARVTGVELSALSPEDIAVLRGLLAEHGVLLLPTSRSTTTPSSPSLRSFGELTFPKGETHVDGTRTLNVVSNVAARHRPRARSTSTPATSLVSPVDARWTLRV